MATHKSAEKRNRQSIKREARNVAVRTQVKTAVKKFREAVAAKDPARAKEALVAVTRTLDKAASKGVIHARNASRHVSRLTHHLAVSK